MVTKGPRFGAFLQKARSDKNMTGYEVAKTVKVGGRAYYDYEAGTRIPSLPTLIRMASVLRIDINTIIQELGSEHPGKAADLEMIRNFFTRK